EVPTETIGPMLAALGRLGAGAATPSPRGELSVLESTLPASHVQELRRQLPGLTGGEGVLDSEFAGYQPVTGEAPIRKRLTPDPRNLEEYLAQVGRCPSGCLCERLIRLDVARHVDTLRLPNERSRDRSERDHCAADPDRRRRPVRERLGSAVSARLREDRR